MVDILRITSSNFPEVGQMRRRRGTSTKRMTKDEALWLGQREGLRAVRRETYIARAQKTMIIGRKVKMLAMPTARQRIMDIIPSLIQGH